MAINARKAILMRTLIVFGLMCVFASAIIFYLYKLQFVEVNKWEKEAKKYIDELEYKYNLRPVELFVNAT
jgi:cell division protein FtsI/penicillin-binding protein 2